MVGFQNQARGFELLLLLLRPVVGKLFATSSSKRKAGNPDSSPYLRASARAYVLSIEPCFPKVLSYPTVPTLRTESL